jgi:hypothetical protein
VQAIFTPAELNNGRKGDDISLLGANSAPGKVDLEAQVGVELLLEEPISSDLVANSQDFAITEGHHRLHYTKLNELYIIAFSFLL